jgi:RNA recognition motif-containing protein
MAKKSKAQITRMEKRAEARGEVYQPPPEEEKSVEESTPDEVEKEHEKGGNKEEKVKILAAKKLKSELEAIDTDEGLKSKDRRSAKRKAEAIAMESTGCQAEELLQWYEKQGESKIEGNKDEGSKRRNPYIVFIGQLSYDTTRESLLQHIKEEIGEEHKINEATVKIRLLTDSKTKKSRGMAFVELMDPECLYSCLKLHQTMLEGRRINVERSAGGGRNSEIRKTKLKQYRTEQNEYMDTVVKNMIDEYKKTGEIKEGELDEGVVALCTHHSATVVQAGLERYVESNGRDMDNPSAYMTFLLGKLATEGIFDREKDAKMEADNGRDHKRAKYGSNDRDTRRPTGKASSEFAKLGVDMKSSFASSGEQQYSKIFPSMGRGRGRGRGL